LFEIKKTKGSTMALQFQGLLNFFEQIHYVLAFVKDEGNKLDLWDYSLLLIMRLQEDVAFVKKILVLGMSCLKLTNM
jgi:hypothetical protein